MESASCAVSAMASCNASGMAWSAVPTTAHDGIVSHAGTPVGWVAVGQDRQPNGLMGWWARRQPASRIREGPR